MFPQDQTKLRLCLHCRTKYEPLPELHMGGWCPSCGSQKYELAVKSDYLTRPKPEPEKPQPGSSEDYNA